MCYTCLFVSQCYSLTLLVVVYSMYLCWTFLLFLMWALWLVRFTLYLQYYLWEIHLTFTWTLPPLPPAVWAGPPAEEDPLGVQHRHRPQVPRRQEGKHTLRVTTQYFPLVFCHSSSLTCKPKGPFTMSLISSKGFIENIWPRLVKRILISV